MRGQSIMTRVGGTQFEHERNTYQNQATLCRQSGTLLALRELPKVKGEGER